MSESSSSKKESMGPIQYQLDRNSSEYLSQLLRDRRTLNCLPNTFNHVNRILKEEINKVRLGLFNSKGDSQEEIDLPEPEGPIVTRSEKLFVPVKEFPDFNFVGRILGPRGMTAKQLEHDTGCKIMIRGRGSMRDKTKEDQNRGKPNWEHLNEDLHVLINAEDTENRVAVKISRAISEINKLLHPSPDGEDELKKMQLMELAILNGTYRSDSNEFSRSYSYDHPSQPVIFSPLRSSVPSLGPPMYFGTHPSSVTSKSSISSSSQSSQQPIMGVFGYISQNGYPQFLTDMNNLHYVDPYMTGSMDEYGTANGNYC
uniref:Quaking protein n=1 Tax=Dicyema japonicum TaxID=399803 RepID=B9ZYX3_DICJA|nr:quaking protein [Dicyema japonicum]